MTIRTEAPALARRALRIIQADDAPLFLFSLTASEILQIADISRVSRDDLGELIGYQRPEVRQHIQEITEYLDGDQVLFPNPIIIALPSTVRFTCSRGPNVSDGIATSGTLEIPLAGEDARKPGWIVDGQQRAYALARARRQDFPVPVNAFIANSVDVQRDQFLRINNTKPLPRGLVTELLPKISTLPAAAPVNAEGPVCPVRPVEHPRRIAVPRPDTPPLHQCEGPGDGSGHRHGHRPGT